MILLPTHIAIDYSFARPAPTFIAAADVRLVCRYISPIRGNKKNLTIAERDALHDAGLSILLVWENGQLDPMQGAPKGQLHGKDARSYANDLGYPKDLPIIAAVDFDVQPAQMGVVLAYLQAFHAEAAPIGAYGKDTLITAAHDLAGSTLGWQTVAWSGGRRSPHADVLQHARPVHPTVPPLGAVDDNTVLRAFRAWSAMPDPPNPNPQPEDDMKLLQVQGDPAVILVNGDASWVSGDSSGLVAMCGPILPVPRATYKYFYFDGPEPDYGTGAGNGPTKLSDFRGRRPQPTVVIPPITVPPLTGHISADLGAGGHITGSVG